MSEGERGRTTKRIAVVDDSSEFLRLLEELLTEGDYEAVLWAGGTGAREMLVREQPDLVILDIRMEREDTGMRVLEMLRRDPQTAAIPVIVCTADLLFLRREGERLRELGCAVLAKPFALDALLGDGASADSAHLFPDVKVTIRENGNNALTKKDCTRNNARAVVSAF